MSQENKKQHSKPPSLKRKKREKASILWHFESMDRVNRAMQGTNDLDQMMKDVLDTLLSVFECDRAWLVYPCDPDYPTWQVPMERTRPEYPGVLPIGVELPLDPIGAEVYRMLRKADGPVKFGAGEKHPVPAEIAAVFDVQSFIAMAFYPKVGRPWSFGLHQCSYARVWTPEEERLFQEIGRRLSDALTSLLAFRNLQESEKQIKHLIDASPVAMVVSSGAKERVEWVNEKFIELFGYTAEDIPDVEHWWPLAYPDEIYRAEIRAGWEANVEGAIRERVQIQPMEATVRCKDGSRRHIEFRLSSIGEKHLVTFVDLTERREAEEKLRASEHKYREIFENVSDALFLLEVIEDGHFRNMEVNRAFEKSTGFSREQLLGKVIEETVPEETANLVNAKYRRCVDAGTIVDEEVELNLPTGPRAYHSSLIPIHDDNGRVYRIIGITRDITEHKQAAAQLLASEQLFRALVENSPDFIARYDREFRRIYINPAIQKLFGVPAKNVLGRTPSEQSPVYAPQVYIDHLRRVIETATETATEMPYRTAKGEMHWGHMRFVPEFGPDGKVDSVLAIGRDIHEIKENERRFRMLAENFPDLVMRFDREGRYIYVNPAFEKAFGISSESVIGKTLQEPPYYIKTEQGDEFLARIRRVFDEGTANETEVRWDTKLGERIFENRYVPEKDAAGNVVTVLCLARDLTERKQAEDELRQNREATLQFSEQLATLQNVTNELSKAESFDDLCLRAVQLGRSRLGFDRASIWFIEESLGIMRGSFGTDERGELRDERNAQVEFRHEGLGWFLFSHKEPMALVDHLPLYDHLGREVGLGDNALAALWDGDDVIGVISVDNLFTAQPIKEHQLDVLRLYATTLGHLITRKRAEEELQRTNDLLRAIIEAAPTAIIGLDLEGKVQHVWNPAAEKMLGWSTQEAMGNYLPSVPLNKEGEFLKFREWIRSGRTLNGVEVQRQRRDGIPIDYSIYASPLHDPAGKITGSIAVLVDITERKRAEKALQESEEKYRLLHENAGVGIGYYKPDGRIISYNQLAASHMRGKPKDFEGKSIYEVFPREGGEFYMGRIRKSLETESTLEYEDHLELPSGEKWFLSVFTRICDAQRNVIGVQIISQDITEQKRAEAALRASENRFRVLSENAFVGIYIIQDGRLSYVNSTLAKIFGYTPEELTGADPALVIHPDDQAMVSENIRRRIVGEVETVHYEFRGRCKDGGTKNIEVLGGRIDFGGKTAVIGNLMDITERKRAEEALRNSERRLIEAQRIAHVGYWERNFEAGHVILSDEACRIFGLSPQEVPLNLEQWHQRWLELIHPEDRSRTGEAAADVLGGGPPYNVEYRIIRPGGEVRFIHSEASVRRDESGRPRFMLGMMQDITDRKQAEEEVRKLNQELEQRVADRTVQLEEANKELEAFAYSVSHDLRAPLRHVDGFIELLQKRMKSDLDEKSQHYLEMIADSARKMGILIDDLLSFSRMSRAEIFKSQIDLNELVQGVIQEFLPEIAGRNIDWQIGPLPRVTGDRAMLRAALVNLLSNALKFTRQRTIARIKIGCEKENNDEAILFVSDNGVGFDMKYADKLFGVFQRLHHEDEFEGTGIGLANVRRIVNRHGGRIWAEGEVGHGATFYFSLPTSK